MVVASWRCDDGCGERARGRLRRYGEGDWGGEGEGGGEGGRRRGGDRWRGDVVQGFERSRCGERESAAGGGGRRGRGGGEGGRGGGEEGVGGGVYERGDGGGAAHAAADAVDGAAGEAGEDDEARHGAREREAGELRGGESALQPELGQGVSPLRIAELPSQGRAGGAGESHAASEDDDAQPRGVVAEDNLGRSIEQGFAYHQTRFARWKNGSFGSCPQSVLAAWSQCWLRCHFGPLEAQLHCAPVEEVLLLENVTASACMMTLDVMCVFGEGRYIREDSIVMLSFTYGAVKKAFQAYASRFGARTFQVQIPCRVSSENKILETFEEALTKEREEHPRSITRLADFDRIISMSTMILPICELVKLWRSYGVGSIFIDGTHVVGNLKVSMEDIDANFYISNLRKWMSAPSTTAFFYCKSEQFQKQLSLGSVCLAALRIVVKRIIARLWLWRRCLQVLGVHTWAHYRNCVQP